MGYEEGCRVTTSVPFKAKTIKKATHSSSLFCIHATREYLFLVAFSTLGRTLFHRFVANKTDFAVRSFFVDRDFCRGAFVALGAIAKLGLMSLVVEGNLAHRRFCRGIGDNVGSKCRGGCKAQDQREGYGTENGFFHVTSP